MIDSPILKRKENETEDSYLIRLYSNKDIYGIDKFIIAELMNAVTGKNCDESKWRKDYAQFLRWKNYQDAKSLEDDNTNPLENEIVSNYKSEVEILKDGTHKSNKLIKMSDEDSKNSEFLLISHGYDPKHWEVVNAKSSIWNQHNKEDGTLTLFSSKLTVKPKVTGFNVEDFLEKANKKIKPVYKEKRLFDGTGLLEIPLFDLHFGVNSYESYEDVKNDILSKITSRVWDKVFFIIGQDLLHNNGFDGKTSSGTPIEKVNMDKAWEDAFNFYSELIFAAQNNANSVDASYSIANHDDSMSWAFVKCLEIKFPDVKFDTSKKVRKGFVWNDVFIGYTHGHKGANRLHENFLSDFGKQMAVAKVVEIHSGHLHAEAAKDKFGVLVRTLSTKGITDGWHDDNGFTGSHKRFQLFAYSPDSLDTVYYI